MNRKKYVVVTSHGWSASNWLAHVMNTFSEVVCTHSARNELADDLELQSDKNLKMKLKQLHRGYVNRRLMTVDERYDEIEKMGEGQVLASVHVFRMRDLPMQLGKNVEWKRKYQVFNLIRHPMDMVWSGYGQFLDLFLYDINELWWTTKKVVELGGDKWIDWAAEYDFYPGLLENLAFLGACAVMSGLKQDLEAVKVVSESRQFDYRGEIKMEEVTKSKKALGELMEQVLERRVADGEVERVMRLGKINEHKKSGNMSTVKRYRGLKAWQKEALKYFLNKFGLVESYLKLGYNFDFLE